MGKPKNIILIVADSLRFDSVYGSRNIGMPYAQKHAKQFTAARSAGCWTLPATASLFTGKMPHEHGATSQSRKADDSLPTLAEKLKAQGYYTAQVTANVVTTEIFGLDKGFDAVHKIWQTITPHFKKAMRLLVLLGKPRVRNMLTSKDKIMNQLSEDLEVGNCWMQNTFEDTFDKAKDILQQNKDGKNFLFLNLMESHFPYHIGPNFKLSAEGWYQKLKEMAGLYHMLNQSFLTKDKEFIHHKTLSVLKARQQESWKILQQKLDEFIQELHQDKDTLVVFCADHGDNFGDQHWVYHFSNVTDAGNRVPLLWLDHEDREGERMDKPVSSRFIHQSILDACGLPFEEGTLFKSPEHNFPILQSFWYNNHEKTLDKYRYNQLCFIDGDMRYAYRKQEWFAAPVGELHQDEPLFQSIGKSVDPLKECALDSAQKKHLEETLHNFKEFSDNISF
jgi:arylsulfatase A-like enzyme